MGLGRGGEEGGVVLDEQARLVHVANAADRGHDALTQNEQGTGRRGGLGKLQPAR